MFLNRASKDNLEVLIKVLALRKEMAELLGYKTYAEYQGWRQDGKATTKCLGF